MTSTTILSVLLVFSFVIGRFLRRFDTPHFVFSGMLYLIAGLLLGSHLGLGLLTEEMLYKLEPMTDLMIGIAGFLLGLRFKNLMVNKRSFVSGSLTALFTFILTGLALFFVAPYAVDFTNITLDLGKLKFLEPKQPVKLSLDSVLSKKSIVGSFGLLSVPVPRPAPFLF
jgi:hypothetical protein